MEGGMGGGVGGKGKEGHADELDSRKEERY